MKRPVHFKSKEYEDAWEKIATLFAKLEKQHGNKATWEKIAVWLKKTKIKRFGKATISNTINGKTNAMKARQLFKHLEAYFTFLDTGKIPPEYVIEEDPEIGNIDEPIKKYLSEMSEKLYSYSKQWFYLYFYDALKSGEEGVLARAKLYIDELCGENEANVTLENSDKGTNYSGKVRLHTSKDYLIFKLQTEKTKEKNLHINVIIKPEQVSELAVGIYCNIDDAGALRAGSLMLQHIKGKAIETMTATSLPKDADEFKKLERHITLFFEKKQLNYLKVTKGIYTYEKLKAFFEKQKKKNKTSSASKDIKGIFLSSPMASLSDSKDLEYMEFRKGVLKVWKELKNIFKCKVYYAGEERPTEKMFREPSICFKYNFDKLNEQDAFVLVYPEKLPTGALVEVGWALAKEKYCLFFVHCSTKLPYILEKASDYPKTRIVQYKSFDDILTYINGHEKNNIFKI